MFQKGQLELPDLELVPIGELVPLDAPTVDVGAVQAVQVLDRETSVIEDDPRMMPGHGDVVEEEITVRASAYREDVDPESDDLPFPTSSGPDKKNRSRDQSVRRDPGRPGILIP